MTKVRVAVLGGDGRELRIASRLADAGYDSVCYGQDSTGDPGDARVATSPIDAVSGSQWLVCPFPGLDRTKVYAPHATVSIVLDQTLLNESATHDGGIIVGRQTPELQQVTAQLGTRVFEMKDDRALATRLSTGVAEGVLRLLIEITTRILRDHRLVLNGYGVTGQVLLDYLVAARCRPLVAARSDLARARADQCGGIAIAFEDRVEAMAEADITINTVPDVNAIPASAFDQLRGRTVVDIASPPGGTDHEAARRAGVVVHWPRGLAGGRAPITAGDAQFAFVQQVLRTHANGSSNGQAPARAALGAQGGQS